ncbi:hypothetical protein H2201_007109 [Coniosporium apollinis]|uniref:PIN domain-containing protein n=2 Tax=Coniosporium TaxID=2810619 RepID=A0ABQ9NJX6_9PEZI|nr:hypothetical protein H2199_004001 [Cladosporium sp. JES 115]KAJ9660004.1 hypothetical protein H2201_007109 [Coniosporium apollinis]
MPTRKVFNCIVDDTALIAGVKKSTRDGIRKWTESGAIRLFVPLHSLEQLNHLTKGTSRINGEAREAVKWLDDVTSTPHSQRVQLQGVDETYGSWEEVEKYLQPQSLLAGENNGENGVDGLTDELHSTLQLHDQSDKLSTSSHESDAQGTKTPSSPRSAYSSTSPGLLNASPYKAASRTSVETPVSRPSSRPGRNDADIQPHKAFANATRQAVPPRLQPLFNHIIWRINQDQNPNTALDSFIFLTNDANKQALAQKFGVKTKRLEQVRDAVAREERDFKNRLALWRKETGITTPVEPTAGRLEAVQPPAVEDDEESEDEDIVVFKRPLRVPSAPASPVPAPALPIQPVIDPNQFSRASPVLQPAAVQQVPAAPRGRGGRPPVAPRGGRGGFVPPPGRFVPNARPRVASVDLNKPIDPDSFARPSPFRGGMRGGRRTLWNPTT